MRRATIAVVALLVAGTGAAQVGELELKRFARAYMAYTPGSVVTLAENALHTAPAGQYQTVRVERTSPMTEGKDQLAMLVDPTTRTAAVGLLFPLPPADPPVTRETLPIFVQQALPQALSSYLNNRVKIALPLSPIRPSGVLSLVAKVETGYGPTNMALAISTDGKYLALGGNWPLDRDPRAVRREILDSAVVQWDPGREKAIVKVVEFSDFQCPACKRGWAMIKPILAAAGEEVRHGLVNFPLYNAHPWAFRAAVAGECIGSTWPDRLTALKEEFYRLQDSLTLESVDPATIGFLAQQGLDEKSFRACYLKDPAIDTVLRQLELGYRLGVFGTPTYYVNGEHMPWGDGEVFSKRLRAIIAAKGRPEDAAEVAVTPRPTAGAGETGKH
jgi:protein-disulfide isomerase